MTIERAAAHAVRKPWGRNDLAPWRPAGSTDGERIGEIRYDRADPDAPRPALLLKLLFTDEPLSIQVHPDDAFARTIGLENGKTEAWYILAAQPHAGVGLGLTRKLSDARLRAAIADRTIVSLVQWRRVREEDVIFVPAGMIHTIGAGLVIAEIQQRSDATFRLFDHDRERGLHTDRAVAASDTSLKDKTPPAVARGGGRSILVTNSAFVLERFVLPPNAKVALDAPAETWLLLIDGDAQLGPVHAGRGDAIFAAADSAVLTAGASGLTALLAYGGPEPRAAAPIETHAGKAAEAEPGTRMMEAHA
jgi:mannose-6-phosphate isomerase